jgi:hypothetical protein
MKFVYALDFRRTDFRRHPCTGSGTGKKYLGPVPPGMRGRGGAHGRRVAPPERDASKLEGAKVFGERLDAVLADPAYVSMREEHQRRHEAPPADAKKRNS